LLYSEKFIEKILSEKDKNLAIVKICEQYLFNQANISEDREIEACTFLLAYAKKHDFESIINEIESIKDGDLTFGDLDFDAHEDENRILVKGLILKIRKNYDKKVQVTKYTDIFESKINDRFTYKLEDKEIDSIQDLLNKLRDMIYSSNEIEDEHKRRLLEKINQLQTELNKEISDFDKFLGLMMETATTFGKAGEAAMPFIKLIHKLQEVLGPIIRRNKSLPKDSADPFSLPKE